jgi:hypothetical protein
MRLLPIVLAEFIIDALLRPFFHGIIVDRREGAAMAIVKKWRNL